MQVISKSGLKLTLEISGTQEEPIIVVEPFKAGGKTIGGKADIQHWKSKGLEEGLYFARPADAYVQAGNAMSEIRAAIAALPRKVYYARIETEIVDLDGDKCPVRRWVFESGMKSPKTGADIGTRTMTEFLNSKKITKIAILEACQMWADEIETDEFIAARKIATEKREAESKRFAVISQQWTDEEEMENGRALPEIRDPTSEYPREG